MLESNHADYHQHIISGLKFLDLVSYLRNILNQSKFINE